MTRLASALPWLAILLIAFAAPALADAPAAASAAAHALHGHVLPADTGEAAAAPSARHADRKGHQSGERTAHDDGTTSCCTAGCGTAALADGAPRLAGPVPRRLRTPWMNPVALDRATSPPHRPPRILA
ncbi:MAG: hypothetical protein WD100_11070 [Tistlia sp.]|uniref:hypothetical protein n=1 Tax=Tistlia sp. TaxID=3057121 RepID=UPI0034A55324